VDNAAESMQDAMLKEIPIATSCSSRDAVELVVTILGMGLGDVKK